MAENSKILEKIAPFFFIICILFALKWCFDEAKIIVLNSITFTQEAVDVVVPDIELEELSKHDLFIPFCKVITSAVYTTAINTGVELADILDDEIELNFLQKRALNIISSYIITKGIMMDEVRLLCANKIKNDVVINKDIAKNEVRLLHGDKIIFNKEYQYTYDRNSDTYKNKNIDTYESSAINTLISSGKLFSVAEYISEYGENPRLFQANFRTALVDLNNNGTNEVIVHVDTMLECSVGGNCPYYILEAINNEWKIIGINIHGYGEIKLYPTMENGYYPIKYIDRFKEEYKYVYDSGSYSD